MKFKPGERTINVDKLTPPLTCLCGGRNQFNRRVLDPTLDSWLSERGQGPRHEFSHRIN